MYSFTIVSEKKITAQGTDIVFLYDGRYIFIDNKKSY